MVGNGSCGHPICFMTHRMQPLIVMPQRSAEERYGGRSTGEYNGYVMGFVSVYRKGLVPAAQVDKRLMVLHRWNAGSDFGGCSYMGSP